MERTGHEMYQAPNNREWILKWFHGGRLADFADFIDKNDGVAVSVGCGTGVFETEYLDEMFDCIYAVDPVRSKVRAVLDHGQSSDRIEVLQGAVPPIPFDTDSVDAVIGAGVTEHLPDERGFIVDAHRVLKPDGKLYLTAPVEVGLGGLLRHWGRYFTTPNARIVPEGRLRYFKYSLPELLKTVPREENSLSHRYYNYTYLLSDLHEWFDTVSVYGWPVAVPGIPKLILFIAAE